MAGSTVADAGALAVVVVLGKAASCNTPAGHAAWLAELATGVSMCASSSGVVSWLKWPWGPLAPAER